MYSSHYRYISDDYMRGRSQHCPLTDLQGLRVQESVQGAPTASQNQLLSCSLLGVGVQPMLAWAGTAAQGSLPAASSGVDAGDQPMWSSSLGEADAPVGGSNVARRFFDDDPGGFSYR